MLLATLLFTICVLSVIAAIFLVVYRLCDGHWPRWLVPEKIDPLLDEMVALIEASLRDAPNEWVSDGYNIVNKTRRISIWIANNEYGVGVKLDGERASPRDGEYPMPLRKRLWQAVQLRNVAAVVDRFRDAA